MADECIRCAWSVRTELEQDYHDREWGVPLHDDRKLFEFLVLDGAQAGLSWLTILRKREAYRLAFDDFDAERIAAYDEARLEELLANPGLVRNRAKLRSAVANAQAFLRVRERFGSFDAYLWRFVDGSPVVGTWNSWREVPAQTPAAAAMSRDLKQRGFNFVGPVICYAFMQAAGMANDHTTDCFRWRELGGE